jgi:hypothetical protein
MYPADKVTTEIYRNANLVFPVRNILIQHDHIPEGHESKRHMLDIFLEDQKGQKAVDIGDYIYKLLKTSANNSKDLSKLQRIINIIKE